MDFGDQSTVALGTLSGTVAVAHLFRRSGVFRVSVTGFDDQGREVQASTQVAVSALEASGGVASGNPTAGNPVVVHVTVTPETASIDTYRWDFGDGTPEVQASSRQISHVYESAGVKTVTVTVVPTAGDEVVTQIQFRVS
jgi:PKD repeat protein